MKFNELKKNNFYLVGQQRKSFHLILFLTIIISSITFWIMISLSSKIPLNLLLKFILDSLYVPGYNYFPMNHIHKINILKLFYLQFLISALLSILIIKICCATPPDGKKKVYKNIITNCIFILIALFCCLQQVARQNEFTKELKEFRTKTTAEKNAIIFGPRFAFADLANQYLSKQYYADFSTDLDLAKDPGMSYHRQFSYHLYPNISIRFPTHKEKNALLFYNKADFREHIPNNYKIYLKSSDNSLILAVKDQE